EHLNGSGGAVRPARGLRHPGARPGGARLRHACPGRRPR
ncbi:MAG: hypothetical protein AVDCRST_MAG69-2673, partial [uncultured Solirubrobacteraceae bacterium]